MAVVDIAMPILNGIDAGYQMKKVAPSVKLIYLNKPLGSAGRDSWCERPLMAIDCWAAKRHGPIPPQSCVDVLHRFDIDMEELEDLLKLILEPAVIR